MTTNIQHTRVLVYTDLFGKVTNGQSLNYSIVIKDGKIQEVYNIVKTKPVVLGEIVQHKDLHYYSVEKNSDCWQYFQDLQAMKQL